MASKSSKTRISQKKATQGRQTPQKSSQPRAGKNAWEQYERRPATARDSDELFDGLTGGNTGAASDETMTQNENSRTREES